LIDARGAARYNVRPLLPGPEDALRDSVVRLGVAVDELTQIAQHGSVEALALQGLEPEQTQVLETVVRAGGGAVLRNAKGDRAVVLAPLLAAGQLGVALTAYGAPFAEVGDAISAVLRVRAAPPLPLRAGDHQLVFGSRTLVMGIVNVTPDSFSGDGVGSDVDAALTRAHALVEEGADVIDIGGESTRPNSQPISADEELVRVLPVLRELAGTINVPISIDTRKAEVARAAIEAGADLVNDVWGLRGDPSMASVLAANPHVGLVAMHNQRGTDYDDLLGNITSALRESLALADAAGIAAERVIVDPGFGFAKTPAQNLELVRRLGELRGLGRAIMVGPSRKSTIGAIIGGSPPDQRVEGSIALAVLCVAGGAHIIRAHDVQQTVRALRAADAVIRGTPDFISALPIPGPTG
jgi:dihydropteroate synthase